jgi:myxalamid-type polyketide synthase MxaD
MGSQQPRTAYEPIAIVGMSCRLPGGVESPAALWDVLRNGVDAIGEIPRDRWDVERYYDPRPATPGKIMTRFGGFIERIDTFDAEFFGISPREAERIDPQQRLLLEMAWEAFADAGLTRSRLATAETGVFVGQWLQDYEARLFEDAAGADFYMTTGSGRYSSSGRLSYYFGLQGPSVTLDTACSSSLVAVHLACQSLRTEECQVALAAAANVVLQPHISIAYSQSRMMASDGRCKFGDARADGYVRSDGAAGIVLKRLSRAQADGDRIHALIRGSAVNNDGRSSGFLASPGQPGQEDMLRKAYRAAGVDPATVDYVEAHGTGTSAGDPVELGALGAIVGTGRPSDRPCIVGSVKTNIGHTEAAAGLAGLMKVVLAMRHSTIPASLHFEQPNPSVPWSELGLRVSSESMPWPTRPGPALAGVSAFGITGTNAHVVLESAPGLTPRQSPCVPSRPRVFTISARSAASLADAARRYDSLLGDSSDEQFAEIAFTAATRREHLDYRLAVVASTAREAREGLAGYLRGETVDHVTSGPPADGTARIVFVFPGQGSQWPGMGRELMQREPAFRDAILACEAAFRPYVNWSLTEQIVGGPGMERFEDIDVVQPTLFAIEVALAAVWRALGIKPDAVVGHSMGEVAAAYVAGRLNLADASRVICTRSALMKRVAGEGEMALVGLSLADANTAIAGYEDRLSVAASNGPRTSVLSGEPLALGAILRTLQAKNVFCRSVKVDVAAHSPHMDPLQNDLRQALVGITPQTGAVRFYSTVSGAADVAICDADYWAANLRQPVLFADAVRRVVADNPSERVLFLELSPHPILTSAVEQTLEDAGRDDRAICSGRRGGPEQAVLLASLGRLHALGATVDWPHFYAGAENSVVDLPTYPWQRNRYWLESAPVARSAESRSAAAPGARLPRLATMGNVDVWQATLAADDAAAVAVERVADGTAISPVTYANLALAALAELGTVGPLAITNMRVHTLQTIPPGGAVSLQTMLSSDAREAAQWRVFGAEDVHGAWTEYASGEVSLRVCPSKDVLNLERPDGLTSRGDATLVEALAHGFDVLRSSASQDDRALLMLTEAAELSLVQPQVRPTSVYARVTHSSATEIVGDCDWYDVDGRVVALVRGARWTTPDERSARAVSDASVRPLLFETSWRAAALDAGSERRSTAGRWLILADESGVGASLSGILGESEGSTIVVRQEDATEVQRLLADDASDLRGVVHLWGLDASIDNPAQAAESLSDSVLEVVQALSRRSAASPECRLWVATRGAQKVTECDSPVQPAQAALWGMGAVVANEHPEIWGGLIDLEATDGEPHPAQMLDELSSGTDSRVAIRASGRFVPRLVPGIPRPEAAPPRVRADASYLITGGSGGLGLETASWLAASGARHIALVSRGRPDARAQASIGNLERAGVQVMTLQADVADADQLRSVIARIQTSMPPLRGVFHAAGVLQDAPLMHQTTTSMHTVLAPKVRGAWNLHALTAAFDLDFFVLFSSISALVGTPGQANYAAGNAFMDGLAQLRRARGLPALAVNWGPWAEVGLATLAQRGEHLARRGIHLLEPREGRLALDLLTRDTAAQMAVVRLDPSATFTGLSTPAPEHATPHQVLIDDLEQATSEARFHLLAARITREVGTIMQLDSARSVDPTRGFFQQGMDSLMAVELRARLQNALGRPLRSTVIFDYPTVTSLAAYILGELFPPVTEARPMAAEPTPRLTPADDIGDLTRDELESLLERELDLLGDRTAR